MKRRKAKKVRVEPSTIKEKDNNMSNNPELDAELQALCDKYSISLKGVATPAAGGEEFDLTVTPTVPA